MPVYIALLRGINVGGNKKIKMADLTALLESLGFVGAQTLLQSGNVVFKSDLADSAQIARQIESGIEATFGFQSQILLRTLDQFRAAVESHPFSADQINEPAKILLMFLSRTPDSDAVDALVKSHAGPEEMTLKGDVLYIFYPDGMGRSKLDHPLVERRLKVAATGRNWNTVTRLIDLGTSFVG